MILVAPTEPPKLRAIGKTSMLPEKYGADIAWRTHGEWVGVQRKEVKDLLQSVADGRLGVQVAQMKSLGTALLLIEGELRFSLDGVLMTDGWGQEWTRNQVRGLLWSVRRELEGVWIDQTKSLEETVEYVVGFHAWTRKAKHTSLRTRPGPTSVWGRPDNRDFARHLLSGLPGVGPELADRLYDQFGVPFTWAIEKRQLEEVEGIGPKKAEKIWRAIPHE